jgi:hypothetical protein
LAKLQALAMQGIGGECFVEGCHDAAETLFLVDADEREVYLCGTCAQACQWAWPEAALPDLPAELWMVVLSFAMRADWQPFTTRR